MIEIKKVSFQHENAEKPSLKNVSLTIAEGECVLLCGESGSGKTTVTRLINGLIPHFYEGKMEGCAMVNGLNVTEAELYDTARIVGSVFQNPRSQFFCVDTTSELAFGCENMGMPEGEILSRVDEAAKELNIEKLLGRSIFELSGGEKQKISCASVSALRPEVMVLDEPTSNLDVHAIEELKQTLLGWKAAGKTILIAEHRLSWLRDLCDRVICMRDGQVAFDLSMQAFTQYSTEQLHQMGLRSLRGENIAPVQNSVPETETMQLQNFCFSYDGTPVLNIPHLSLPLDSIIALVGPNGAGKSTFSRCLCGLEKKFKGQVKINGQLWKNRQLLKNCYMVMQDVNHQLFCETVADEVQLGMRSENSSDVERVLEMPDLSHLRERHPMSLSGGQKQRVAIASAILAGKEILIFDEPTSGLDFRHMEQTAALLSSLKGKQTVLIVTHDPELIQRCCDHIVCIENGTVI
ncbi:ABC transporter ATP-binding protein [Candidatus Pseudoscillospira sp. SGI.172]|uniref:ABC transporter ATP-binding protein n=1 Tax=Candidatus Pseudoscillospira sp. SGI.172 TaxID=3420582 RepID=UPI003D013958